MTSQSDIAIVLFHRVLAQHEPFEVCDECPQPATSRVVAEDHFAKAMHREELL